jgi:hypothetical protein
VYVHLLASKNETRSDVGLNIGLLPVRPGCQKGKGRALAHRIIVLLLWQCFLAVPLRDKLLCVQLAGRSVKNHGRPAEANSSRLPTNSWPLKTALGSPVPLSFLGFAEHALSSVLLPPDASTPSEGPQLTLPPTYADPSSSLFVRLHVRSFVRLLSLALSLLLVRSSWCCWWSTRGG